MFVSGFFCGLTVALIVLLAGALLCSTLGNEDARKSVQQEAVDRGFGYWTIIAGKPVFEWEGGTNDDATPDANQPATAPSSEEPAPAHDY